MKGVQAAGGIFTKHFVSMKTNGHYKLVFGPFRPFQPGEIFASKLWSLPQREAKSYLQILHSGGKVCLGQAL
jgi:hypothetical protein